jgi:hypothetical protein
MGLSTRWGAADNMTDGRANWQAALSESAVPIWRSRRSQFQSVVCAEDLQHVQEILNAENVENGDVTQLKAALYMALTRPVQMACDNLVRLGN